MVINIQKSNLLLDKWWIIPAASQHRANSGSSTSSSPPFTIKLFDCQTCQQPSASLLMHEHCGAHSSVIEGSTSLGRQRCVDCFSAP